MSWDNYIRAVLRIELPAGTLRIKAAPLGKSHDIDFPGSAGGTVHVITAYNPAGTVAPDEANTSAHERLTAKLQEIGATYFAAAGGDVQWTHVEPSVAVIGMTDEDARALGREFGQDAIFGWSPTALVALSCDTSKIHMTGWDVLPDPASDDVEEVPEQSVVAEAEPPTDTESVRDIEDDLTNESAVAVDSPTPVRAPEERQVDVMPLRYHSTWSRADFAGRSPGNPVAPGAIPSGDQPNAEKRCGISQRSLPCRQHHHLTPHHSPSLSMTSEDSRTSAPRWWHAHRRKH
jgi:Protein of unknown function (DUF3293)